MRRLRLLAVLLSGFVGLAGCGEEEGKTEAGVLIPEAGVCRSGRGYVNGCGTSGAVQALSFQLTS